MNTPRTSHEPPKTILLVEDEMGIAQTISVQLQLVGYQVFHVLDGKSALNSPHLAHCHVIILDWMLPDSEGPELIPQIRRHTTAPILMLTARSEIVDKLTGFEAGADDYLTKPFEMMELIARIKALIRRQEMQQGGGSDTIQYGEISFHPETRQVKVRGKAVKLTPTEFRLLEILIQSPGRVFSRDELIELVLGYEYEGYGRTLDSHIARLRAKIEKDPGAPRYIQTIFGVGYKLGEKE